MHALQTQSSFYYRSVYEENDTAACFAANCKRLIALLQLLLNFAPVSALAAIRPRPPVPCPCCAVRRGDARRADLHQAHAPNCRAGGGTDHVNVATIGSRAGVSSSKLRAVHACTRAYSIDKRTP
jgi:hypothetical protein